MSKEKLSINGVSGILVKIKENSTFILFAIVIILLLILHFEKMSKIEDVTQILNRIELDNKSIKLLIDKQSNQLSNQVSSLSDGQQRISTIEQEQSKTLSIIPTDNDFFKKWLKSNHEETVNSIQGIKTQLEEMKNKLNDINSSISNIGTATTKVQSNDNLIPEHVESTSI